MRMTSHEYHKEMRLMMGIRLSLTVRGGERKMVMIGEGLVGMDL